MKLRLRKVYGYEENSFGIYRAGQIIEVVLEFIENEDDDLLKTITVVPIVDAK